MGAVRFIINPTVEWSSIEFPVVGGAWFVRSVTVGSAITYNTTTLRFLSLTTPMPAAGGVNDLSTESSFRLPRSISITAIWVLLIAANNGSSSATFALNIDGATAVGSDVTVGFSVDKAGATMVIPVNIDTKLCLECTATAGTPQSIKSIGIAWREQRGTGIA